MYDDVFFYKSNENFGYYMSYVFSYSHSWIVVVGQDPEKPVVDGRRADALLAAHYAQEAAIRLVKPGNEVNLSS